MIYLTAAITRKLICPGNAGSRTAELFSAGRMLAVMLLAAGLFTLQPAADPIPAPLPETETEAAADVPEERDALQEAAEKRETGLVRADGEVYYLVRGKIQKRCWKKVKGRRYYFTGSGKAYRGCSVKKGKKYWIFLENGELAAAEGMHFVTLAGKKYMAAADGSAPGKGWHTYKAHKYWTYKDGHLAAGIKKLSGKYWYFTAKGRLGTAKKNRIVSVGETDYLVKDNGELGKGWCSIGKKFCFCRKDGSLVKDVTKNGIRINREGLAKTRPMSALEKTAYRIVQSITTEEMSKGERIAACWNYITSHDRFSYRSQYDPAAYNADEFRRLALLMLQIRGGNCYGFAAAFAALTKAAGCTSYVIYGLCEGTRDRRPDGLTRHGWVYIKDYGYFDPEGQYAGFAHIYGWANCPWYPQGRLEI